MRAVQQIQQQWRAASSRNRRAHVVELNRSEVEVAAAQELDAAAFDLIEQIRCSGTPSGRRCTREDDLQAAAASDSGGRDSGFG